MENYQGDLTDIVRASGGQIGCNNNSSSASASDIINSLPTWEFPSDPLGFCSSIDDHRDDNLFGDPFSSMRDPLLHELNIPGNSCYYNPPNMASAAAAANSNVNLGHYHHNNQRGVYHEDELKSPCNVFSRIQISASSSSTTSTSTSSSSSQTRKLHQPVLSPFDSPPPVMAAAAAVAASPRGIKAPAIVASDMINANSSSSKNYLVDNTGPGQISSPRNLGIKRRKSQAKKVICIPAPAAANSRSSGEVVPSDLWAWRKYGQKPIKGSPYPRGYYRCSSSKGCSARKQVERSRTDPNMLVITYTSEHNHPWPTQRNALAGSTRSQLSKANNASAAASSKDYSYYHQSTHHQNTTNNKTKEEEKESSSNDGIIIIMSPNNNNNNNNNIKEEIEKPSDDQMESTVDEFNEGFCDDFQTYKPALPEPDQSHHEDFFAELGEIEADDDDPLNVLFAQGFSTGDHHPNKETKSLDPFSIFDWSGDDNNNNNNNIDKTLK